jgi:hypothetical protein
VLFLAMDSQWRFAGLGERTGLDYSALETVARLAKVALEPSEELLADLKVMEHAALKLFAEAAERERQRAGANRRR